MAQAWKLGTFFGGDVRFHWTSWLLPPFVFAYTYSRYSLTDAWLQTSLLLCTYVCVFLHEIAHILAGRRLGIGTRDVTLYPFWGVARLTQLSERPWQENYMALAGPATHALIASLIGGALAVWGKSVSPRFDIQGEFLYTLLNQLFWANVLLTVLNCFPAIPLDGGHVFRATLALTTSRLRATEVAALLSSLISIILLSIGLLWLHELMLGAIALLIYLSAQEELGQMRYFASIRMPVDSSNTVLEPTLMVPVDQLIEIDARPEEPNFNGFTWNSKARLWIEWRNGEPISANALLGD